MIIKSFLGPFVLTTLVATFILLIQYMLKYFDDFVGKDLGFAVFAELIFYFSLNMLQVALPLGVLVSSLMTFGNLGENFELTAIKSAGISLVRALRPIFFFVILLSIWAFWFNNNVVPAANLKAYSLLYDIKQTKPALDIKAGVFYNGIPNYSIKASRKLGDNKTMLDVMIYDHTDRDGNRRVILADSSLMYTIYDDKFLKLELYDGNYYIEQRTARKKVDQFFRTSYDQMDLVFPLSSFDLKRTKEELFRNNRQMKDIKELTRDIDSMAREMTEIRYYLVNSASVYLPLHLSVYKDSVQNQIKPDRPLKRKIPIKDPKPGRKNKKNDDRQEQQFDNKQKIEKASFLPAEWLEWIQLEQDTALVRSRVDGDTAGRVRFELKIDSIKMKERTRDSINNWLDSMRNVYADTVNMTDSLKSVYLSAIDSTRKLADTASIALVTSKVQTSSKKANVLATSLRNARTFKVNINSQKQRLENIQYERNKYIVEKYKKYSQAFACIVMFLIGAPLGAIIKKGGLGVPVIISIFFFIIYYVLTITSEKWAKAGIIEGEIAVWTADIILLPFGLFFLRQARIDARLFDSDFYMVVLDRVRNYFSQKRKK